MTTKNRPGGGITRRTALTTLSAAVAVTLTPDLVSGQEARCPTRRGDGAGCRTRSAAARPLSSRSGHPRPRAPARRSRISTGRSRLRISTTNVTMPASPSSIPRGPLVVHGMVDRPLTFTLADLKRFPAATRTCFLECSGNFGGQRAETTPQDLCGMTSQSEWTGVMLSTISTRSARGRARPGFSRRGRTLR